MLRVEEMSFGYHRHQVLEQLTLELTEGQMTAVLGINGSGKSTLLRNMTGILKPAKGTILVEGRDLATMSSREVARQIGYMPQKSNGVTCTVFDAVLLGRKPHISWEATDHDLEVVAKTLRLLGLEEYALRSTAELSGGELQKVVIARALAQEPKTMLLDEPVSHLDIRNQLETMKLLRQVTRSLSLTVAVVIHDLTLALRFADRFILLSEGRLFASGGREVITTETIRAVYHIEALVHDCKGIPVVVPI